MATVRDGRRALVSELATAGCVAAEEEADELIEAAGEDPEVLRGLVRRRVGGEPLAWVTGAVTFAGQRIVVRPGVYVPRPQSEALVRRALEILPPAGLAADLCTGSGAIAAALGRQLPQARIVATDIDPVAFRCAAENGVEVYLGSLAEPLPADLVGHFDLVIAVVPYVPSAEIAFLPRDVRQREPMVALDGGPGGTRVLDQAVWSASQLLRSGGALIIELGGNQDQALAGVLNQAGFSATGIFEDADGDLRGMEATRR